MGMVYIEYVPPHPLLPISALDRVTSAADYAEQTTSASCDLTAPVPMATAAQIAVKNRALTRLGLPGCIARDSRCSECNAILTSLCFRHMPDMCNTQRY